MEKFWRFAGSGSPAGVGTGALGIDAGSGDTVYSEIAWIPDFWVEDLVESNYWRGRTGFSNCVYGPGSYHWNRKYRGSGHCFEGWRAGSDLLDVDLGASWHDDWICGGVAGDPLPPSE